jgi:hypothetical protein
MSDDDHFRREFVTGFARWFGEGSAQLVGCLVIGLLGVAVFFLWMKAIAPKRASEPPAMTRPDEREVRIP